MAYNWLYTSWNENEYILFLIVVILFLIIINFGLWKRKSDTFDNVVDTSNQTTTTHASVPNEPHSTAPIATTFTTTTTKYIPTGIPVNIPTTTSPTTTQSNTSTSPISTTSPILTPTNMNDNLFITPDEKQKWASMWMRLDGNEDSLPYMSNSSINNSISQLDSTLYNTSTSNTSISTANYSSINDWATIDDLGKSLTDTLGGVNSNLGYTVIQEQLGTFKPNYNNPHVYDNTMNYNSSMNLNGLSGVNSSNMARTSTLGSGTSYQQVGKGTPVFLQKDFAGVANIFAPNIYISSDKAFDENTYPNVSYSV